MAEELKGDDIHLNAKEEAALQRAEAARDARIARDGPPPRRPLPGQPKSMKDRQEAREKPKG